MGRPNGQPKVGGRQKGAKNKRTVEFEERLKNAGFDPLQVLVDIVSNPLTDDNLRAKICSDTLQYLYPKRKAIEGDIDINTQQHITVSFDGLEVD